MTEVLMTAALVLAGVCAIEAWVFVARHSRTEWWENAEGRYLMRSKVASALLFTMILVFQFVHPKLITRAALSVLVFGFIAYTLADLLILQSRAKRERAAERVAASAASTMAERDAIRNAARDVLRDEPRDEARDEVRDIARDKERDNR